MRSLFSSTSARSELSYSDDKLSLASAGTASTAGGTSSKLAPLLFVKDEYRGGHLGHLVGRGRFLWLCFLRRLWYWSWNSHIQSAVPLPATPLHQPQPALPPPSLPPPPTLPGDDVKPFFVDQPLLTAASPRPEDLEDPTGLEAGAEGQQRRQPGGGARAGVAGAARAGVAACGALASRSASCAFCDYVGTCASNGPPDRASLRRGRERDPAPPGQAEGDQLVGPDRLPLLHRRLLLLHLGARCAHAGPGTHAVVGATGGGGWGRERGWVVGAALPYVASA